MVIKKYLCSAPRPETWDDKAKALLQSVGGDVAKRDAFVQQTLRQLKASNPQERRAGPGRKSNAEHAIAFYEYVLMREEDEEPDDTTRDPTKFKRGHPRKIVHDDNESLTVESMDSQEFLNQHNDLCDVCSRGGELLCCSTCNLVFHLHCVRPVLKQIPSGDDWSCAHCILSGWTGHKRHSKVYKAAVAGIRHMGKLRRRSTMESGDSDQEEDDDDDESSFACSKSMEEATDNGESKGVAGNARVDASDSKSIPGGGSSQDAKASTPKSTPTHTPTKQDSSEKKKCRSLALYKISDALSPSMKVESPDDGTPKSTGRVRRQRRQPALYEPQNCPDSQWQSDERAVWLIRESTPKDDDDGGTGGGKIELEDDGSDSPILKRRKKNQEYSEANEEGKGKSGFTWCNFCKDDPSIPLCVFCACRVCFGKHEKSKLLLCDKCDEEYHTFCLDPPLSTVPSSRTWFCPNCEPNEDGKLSTPTSSNKMSTRGARIFTTPGSSKSTPRNANESTSSSGSKKSDNKKSPSAVFQNSSSTPGKRPRGRPPKSKTPPPQEDSASSATATPSARKRGRPTKSVPSGASTPNSGESTSPTKRKRGRPPKTSVAGDPAKKTPKRSISPEKASRSGDSGKRARVDVNAAPSEKSSSSTSSSSSSNNLIPVVPSLAPGPVKTSRSGRIVKRNSFHDEVDEGEQHLRSQRYQAEMQRKTEAQNLRKQQQPQQLLVEAKRPTDSTVIPLVKPSTTQTKQATTSSQGKTDEKSKPPASKVSNTKPVKKEAPKPATPAPEMPAPEMPAPARPISSKPTPKSKPAVPSILPKEVTVLPHGQAPMTAAAAARPSAAQTSLKASPPSTPAAVAMKTPPLPQAKPTETKIATVTRPSSAPPIMSVTTKQITSTSTTPASTATGSAKPSRLLEFDIPALVKQAIENTPKEVEEDKTTGPVKQPRRKPGARECMQISRRFGVRTIPKKYMNILLDYCTRGKVEHLIRMRERLDEHSRFLEHQLAGLEALILEKGTTDIVVPPLPERQETKPHHPTTTGQSTSTASSTGTIGSAVKTQMATSAEHPKTAVPNAKQGSINKVVAKPSNQLSSLVPAAPAHVSTTVLQPPVDRSGPVAHRAAGTTATAAPPGSSSHQATATRGSGTAHIPSQGPPPTASNTK